VIHNRDVNQYMFFPVFLFGLDLEGVERELYRDHVTFARGQRRHIGTVFGDLHWKIPVLVLFDEGAEVVGRAVSDDLN